MTETVAPAMPTAIDQGQPVSSQEERRQHFRIRTELEVEILWQTESGEDRRVPAILREVSVGGCRIEIAHSLEVDQTIVVRVGKNSLNCAVRHVQPTSQGFVTGLTILPTRSGGAFLDRLERLSRAFTVARRSSR